MFKVQIAKNQDVEAVSTLATVWVRATFKSYSIESLSVLACDRYRFRFNVELVSNLGCLNLDCPILDLTKENAPRAQARVGYINSKSGYCTRHFCILFLDSVRRDY
jgi:hypothetical protein